MSFTHHRVRRATIDDRPALLELWRTNELAVEELERRLTEFQVVTTPEGEVIAALGVFIVGNQALLHSEAFADYALADACRARLWERVEAIALNQHLVRLWTTEKAPFYTHNGLQPPDAEALKRLPAGWDALAPAWLTLKLRDEVEAVAAVTEEFADFMASEKERSQAKLAKARTAQQVFMVLAVLLGLLVMAAVVYLLQRSPGILRPGG